MNRLKMIVEGFSYLRAQHIQLFSQPYRLRLPPFSYIGNLLLLLEWLRLYREKFPDGRHSFADLDRILHNSNPGLFKGFYL